MDALSRRARFAVSLARTSLALLAALQIGKVSGSAFRLYPADRGAGWQAAPTAQDARRWKQSVWRPGSILEWQILEDEDWQPRFAGASEVAPLVEQVIEEWGSIPTADLRMRLVGVAQGEGPVRDGRRRAPDGRNTVHVDPSFPSSYATIWEEKSPSTGLWEVTECDVGVGGEVLRPSSDSRATDAWPLTVLTHEFGHCLGLAHGAAAPVHLSWQVQRDNVVGWRSSVMQKRVSQSLTDDDALGVSLLRPAPGWLQTTGSLAGRVTVDGHPLAMASVHLLRRDNGRLRATGVQVFTNGTAEGTPDTGTDGLFRAEGLAPGDYLLWIHPMFKPRDHGSVISRLKLLETAVDDLVLPQLFRVEAGRETWVGEFALQRGRHRR